MGLNSRSGDDGFTDFADGRVTKDHPAIETLGALDETGAALGLAAALLNQTGPSELVVQVRELQRALLDLGACLAGLKTCDWLAHVVQLEELITANTLADPMAGFVLQGQSPAGAALQLARTAARRAERRWLAATSGPGPELAWLNRLSKLLFVLALKAEALARN